MRKKTIKIPIYFGELILLQMGNLKSIEKKYKLRSLHGIPASAFVYPKKNGYTRYIIACNYDVNARMIAHESLHTVDKIFEDRGILMDLNNDEPQAYLLGWIAGECHKFLKVKKIK
jgi:hypothetical protein